MRQAKLISILSIFVFISSSCEKKTYPIEPQLNFISMSETEVPEGVNQVVQVVFGFSDGDGDIGYNALDSTNNIFFTDKRYDSTTFRFQFPEITAENNPEQGVKGKFAVDLNAGFLFKRTDTAHTDFDTIVWEVYIVDQAGRKSNVVETSSLILY